MSFTLTGTIAGVAVTGFATPVFTIVEDTAAAPNTRRWFCTVAATAPSSVVHAASNPFIVELTRPASFKSVPSLNSTTGFAVKSTGKNSYRIRIIKGTVPSTGLYDRVLIDCQIGIPAGSEVNDVNQILNAWSLFGGFINENPAGLGDTLVDGRL
jgi:hypothetical protein